MIFDHGDIDIVLSATNNKVTAFPKESMNDLVYGAQNRLFAFLHKRGIVVSESIQAGAFCGAMEAMLQKPFKESIESAKLDMRRCRLLERGFRLYSLRHTTLKNYG